MIFEEKVTEQTMWFDFLDNFCLKYFSFYEKFGDLP